MLINEIRDYYSKKVRTHGATHLGVDWNSIESQTQRFEQLTRVLNGDNFSVNDLGCGYGALYKYLSENSTPNFRYCGFDVSPEMIETANKEIGKNENVTLACSDSPGQADYTIASGIFNVKLNASDDEWTDHVHTTLGTMNNTSTRGFSLNILTIHSDREHRRDYLYYADPAKLFNYCVSNFSRRVALLQDYGLYEFTIIVRKN